VHYRHFPLLEQNFGRLCTFRGSPAPPNKLNHVSTNPREKRGTTQPIAKSAGCIFQKSGEMSRGNWWTSSLKIRPSESALSKCTVNFIVNDGGATATEMLELIEPNQASGPK